jgi:hypothetical protein
MGCAAVPVSSIPSGAMRNRSRCFSFSGQSRITRPAGNGPSPVSSSILNRVFGGSFDTCAVLRSCQAAPSSTVSAGDGGARSVTGTATGSAAASVTSKRSGGGAENRRQHVSRDPSKDDLPVRQVIPPPASGARDSKTVRRITVQPGPVPQLTEAGQFSMQDPDQFSVQINSQPPGAKLSGAVGPRGRPVKYHTTSSAVHARPSASEYGTISEISVPRPAAGRYRCSTASTMSM